MKAKSIKSIAVLTGGGDCPGLNAVIRAVSKTAINKFGLEVWGIEDGYLGLIEDRMRVLRYNDVSNILTVGGTILGSSNVANPFKYQVTVGKKTRTKDVSGNCIKNLKGHSIDALICIGGDGTMASAAGFAKKGINVIGMPKTIDNDLYGTDITFGFNTAVNTATEAARWSLPKRLPTVPTRFAWAGSQMYWPAKSTSGQGLIAERLSLAMCSEAEHPRRLTGFLQRTLAIPLLSF